MLVRFLKDYAGWRVGDVRESTYHELDQLLLHGIVEPAEAPTQPAATQKVRHATAKPAARTADVRNDEG